MNKMIRISVEMPAVTGCSIPDCAYNTESACHARAITVGNALRPECDTFFSMAQSGQEHTKAVQRQAGIGACKISDCSFNDDFECAAEGVSIGIKDGLVSCMTYEHN